MRPLTPAERVGLKRVRDCGSILVPNTLASKEAYQGLLTRGLIHGEPYDAHRTRLWLARDGASTQLQIRPREDQKPWSAEETDRLFALVGEGLSIGEAGRRIGRTRNAALGKWHREVQAMGGQAL